MGAKIAITPEFRLRIIALLLYSDWLSRYGMIILPEHFSSDDEKSAVKWVNNYYAKYQTCPSDADIDEGLNNNPLLDDARLAAESEDLSYVADEAIEFAQVQAMKLAVIACAGDIKDGNYANMRQRVEDALAVGRDKSELGWEYVENIDDWMYSELQGRRYPTGWLDIDSVLRGGLVAGEYGLILAPTGHGKSTALVNIGYALAGLMGNANVLHVTYEMPKQKVLQRYYTRMTGKAFTRGDAVAHRRDVKNEALTIAGMNLKARLRAVYPEKRTVSDLRQLIEDLGTSEEFVTEALIVDYADLMEPERKRNEYRFELDDIARSLRELGAEYGMPVWSASQAGRHAINKSYTGVADIAESIGKASIADVIISISQTKDEKELGRGRLCGVKMRNAPSFVMPVKIDFSKQMICKAGKIDVG